MFPLTELQSALSATLEIPDSVSFSYTFLVTVFNFDSETIQIVLSFTQHQIYISLPPLPRIPLQSIVQRYSSLYILILSQRFILII